MPGNHVLAIDQGTSATKCLLLDGAGRVVSSASAPVPIRYPQPGWVEQDATEILASVLRAASECLEGFPRGAVLAVGLSTQRESAVVWDRRTGLPAGPVLGWQDQRGLAVCLRLQRYADQVRDISGLPLDPMFSAAKLRWLLDRAPDAVVGTVDAWLMFALTGRHQIEVGNASRTQLLDVATGAWSPELLEIFGVPSSALPEVVPSAGDLGRIGPAGGVLAGLPVTAVLGDSHAALYAHGPALLPAPPSALPSALPSAVPSGPSSPLLPAPASAVLPGPPPAALSASLPASTADKSGAAVKVTFGTGSSVMRLRGAFALPTSAHHQQNASSAPVVRPGRQSSGTAVVQPDAQGGGGVVRGGRQSKGAVEGVVDRRVCRTIAWADPQLWHAAEGNIRSSGATVAWLAGVLGVDAGRVAELAATATSDGVHLVPAFGGLAAPWWDDTATGLITGLTLGTGPAQLARAAIESIAHQVADVVEAMGPAAVVLADGGAAANDQLMQIQADLLGVPVRRARTANLSALGAAHLAGRAAGLWPDAGGPGSSGDAGDAGLPARVTYDEFRPDPHADAARSREAWRAAVNRALTHPEESI